VRNDAIKTYFSGVSGRGVGRLKGFSKANIYNWLKKPNQVWISEITAKDVFEMDELYHFIEHKPTKETRENVYVMTLISREPRQIVGFDVAVDRHPERLQSIVHTAPEAENYATDGYLTYVDLVYPGKHIRNVSNKNDTFTVEGINADLRHYIPVLRRRSRCFSRKLETLEAVLSVFIDAYNKFGEAKAKYIARRNLGKESRELPFGVVDFL
jgi:IS1 family transposase